MKMMLVLAIVALALVVVPAPTEAHEGTCTLGDAACWRNCQTTHLRYPTDLPHSCKFVLP